MNDIQKSMMNLRTILVNNNDDIERIIVSNDFMCKIAEHTDIITIDVDFNEERGYMPFMVGIPIVESQTIKKNAILEMKNGEYVVLKMEEDE